MNIRFLETAIWLAHYRSFKLTAERMFCTQAAVSNRISAIEQELGIRVFERRFRDAVPTQEGEVFLEGAKRIVGQYQALVQQFRPPAQQEQTVRIGLNSSMAYTLLPDIRESCRLEYPDLRLEIATETESSLVGMLEQCKLDACLVLLPEQEEAGLQADPLCVLGMCWVASPLLLMDGARDFAPRDLAQFPIITTAAGGTLAREMGRYVGLEPGAAVGAIASNSVATTVHMALQGAGITLVPEVAVQRELREGRLVRLRVQPAFPPRTYAIVSSRKGDAAASARCIAIVMAAADRFCARFDDQLAHRCQAGMP